MMNSFKQYKRTAIAEMRPVTQSDIEQYSEQGYIEYLGDTARYGVSISDVDLQRGSPKIGDMIARNPKNHNDQWLVAKDYFKENFAELDA